MPTLAPSSTLASYSYRVEQGAGVEKCWCGQLEQVPQPQLASWHWLGHLPSLASSVASLLYKKKISTRAPSRHLLRHLE